MPDPTVPWCVDSKRPPKITSTADGGLSVQAYFRIKWADAFTFTNDVMGLGTVVGFGAPGTYGPWRYPPEPRLLATACEVEPYALPDGPPSPGANKGLAAGEFWEWASAAVTFGVPPGAVQNTSIDDPANMMQFDPANPITMCTQDIEFGQELVTCPIGSYKWATDNKPVNVPVPVRMSTAALTLKFPRIPFIPWSKLKIYIGMVNSEPVLNCGKETLLFEGVSTTQTAQSDGTRDKSVTLKFLWRSESWNTILRPETGGYAQIQRSGGFGPYQLADLRQIFLP